MKKLPHSHYLACITMTALLVACGGGGGGGSTNSTGTTLNVTAATGDPIVGATITVVDGAGISETCSGITNDSGALACSLQNAKTYPFLIQAAKQSSITYAVLPSSSSNVNVTPVSDLMAKKAASDLNVSPSQIMSTPSLMSQASTSGIQTAVDVVGNIIKAVASATTGALVNDPLTGAYNPMSSSDKLDKLIKNLPMSVDASGISISIPTSSGQLVTVSIAINTSSAATATSSTTSQLTSGNVTASTVSLDADAILARADAFITKISQCNATSANTSIKSDIVAMIDPNATYSSGFTKAGWVDDICSKTGLAGVSRYGITKTLGRLGNTSIYFMGLRNPSTGTYVETIVGFKKVGANWYVGADDSPVNISGSVRHALTFNFDTATGSQYNDPKFSYQRYVDAWIGTTDAQNKTTGLATGATAPDKIEIYVMSLADAQTKAAQGTGFPTTPNYTLYRVASPGTTCGNTNYTLRSNRTSCSSYIQDRTSTYNTWDAVDSSNMFTDILEKNDLNVFVYKMLAANGSCLNCDTVGNSSVPRTIDILGRARAFTEIFGTNSATEASLRAGTVLASTANLGTARTVYAAPSQTDLTAIINSFYGGTMGATLTLPWIKPQNYPMVDTGLWGNSYTCNTNKAVDYSVDSFDITGPSYTFTYGKSPQNGNSTPEFGKTFKNAQSISFALATTIQRSEFVFYVQGNLANCTN